jgi:fused signal recognition particle receptor
MPAPKAAAAAATGMTTGQIVVLAVLAVLLIAFAVYVFVIRPRKARALGREGRTLDRGRDVEREREVAEEEPLEEPDEPDEREGRTTQEKAAGAPPRADVAARSADDAKRLEDEEADFRRREAEQRRLRAEDERRRAEDEAIRRRQEEAERKRKSEEERRRRKDEEDRGRAEEAARQKAAEDAKRAAEEADRARREAFVAEKRERLRRLREGLVKTRDEGFVGRIGALLGRKALDDTLVSDLEEIMLTADIGVRTAESLFQRVREGLSRQDLADPAAVFRCLREEASRILDVGSAPPTLDAHHPYVIMVVGVNGSGKTTTIGKLAAQYKSRGKKVVVGAGDTFRAAASEQLAVWADRVGVAIVRKHEGADPSSVLFEAVQEAKRLDADIVIADTAGRLQTKAPLMEELKKIHRVLGRAGDAAPHEVLLVLDSTNGQNAISQAKLFNEALKISGIVMTKLDGTAKGGVILGIVDELKIPVRYIGIGEAVEDLREFDRDDFLEALFEIREADLVAM